MTTLGTGMDDRASDSRWSGGRGGRGRETVVQLGRVFDKLPPHSPEAEQALLGAMILDPRVVGDVISIVKSKEAFYSEANGEIFAALVTLYDRHQSGDLVQLNELLRDKDLLKDVGGADYLVRLAHETPAVASAPHFARIVADKHKLRRLIAAAGQIAFDAYHSGEIGVDGAREIIDTAEQRVFEIAQEEQTADPQALADLVQVEYERLEALHGKGVSGIRTHFHDLDELTSGLQQGELIIIAARPSMGKTALALNLAHQVALGGTPETAGGAGSAAKTPVGFFSLEMSKSSISQRLLSAESRVSAQKMRAGTMNPDEWQSVLRACGTLSEAPLYIDDTPGLSILMLRARARRMVALYGVKCLFVDYLQLMSSPQAARESRQVEVSAISRGIKALARELNIPVVCLSQLNRGPESREANRPRMSDLRESGSIEQDADVVMLLHREEYYHIGDPNWLADNPDKEGLAELIIAKQRNGPTDTVKMTWDNTTTRFKNHSGIRGGGGYADSGYGGDDFGMGPRGGGSGAPSYKVQVKSFAPGPKTGPIADHRDGGGPDRSHAGHGDFDDGGDLDIPI
ncbi:MAG: replicative DNA helicase [Phycisphaeraceae bacterium]|nr:replicative DNA helicase [Phycisphaeraceae bacterium]